jgi:transglutaminase-like putative cysteine protease
MFLAPTPDYSDVSGLSGRLLTISNGQAGVFDTAAAMRQLINAYKTDVEIRTTAANVVFLTPEKNDLAEVEAVFNWVRDHIRYLKDVNQVETLTTPDRTLQLGYGDCDDQVVLLASMLESIGYPTRLVIAGYFDPAIFEHVYLQTQIQNQWIDLDPTEQMPMGFAPPEPLAYWVEPI